MITFCDMILYEGFDQFTLLDELREKRGFVSIAHLLCSSRRKSRLAVAADRCCAAMHAAFSSRLQSS